jgi:hypothetical protein
MAILLPTGVGFPTGKWWELFGNQNCTIIVRWAGLCRPFWHFSPFVESVSYRFYVGLETSTPVASTNNLFIISSLQTDSNFVQ